MRPFLPLALAAAITSACTPPMPGSQFPNRCGPEFNVMVGRNIGEFELPPGLPHRIAQPGAALTEDFNPARLNVFVDDKGWIQKVECW
ncbi:I78 family peptidase inhibitor [Paracoccus albus]|uniref:I78 family peptidase inhibitor n=1 Tax=Paracoccus albus TaxID=3017784 RepID=UPI0022EFFFBB|nr:I78 family peptidase inhibitor [Paracoccus albus]WBU61498.1 I78 family peptidase inhibitor [Paracoccus albus]